jgi:hypothetical protein
MLIRNSAFTRLRGHTSYKIVFIYFRRNELTDSALQMSHCTARNYLFLYFGFLFAAHRYLYIKTTCCNIKKKTLFCLENVSKAKLSLLQAVEAHRVV